MWNLFSSNFQEKIREGTKLVKLGFFLSYSFIYDGVGGPYEYETEAAVNPFVTCTSYVILGNIRKVEHKFSAVRKIGDRVQKR